MAVTKIAARKCTIKFSTSAVTFDTGTALNAETYATTVTAAKNVTITPPKSEVEQIALLGESTVSIGAGNPDTGVYQNAFMDEKNWTNWTATGTLVLTGDEVLETLIAGTGTAITGSYTRYTFGSTTSSKTRVVVGAMLFDLYNGSERATVVMSNVYVNLGEIKPTAVDGHFEVDFDAACLPENGALEYLD